jgi:flagellar hook-basal body complex protein FliE
MKTGSIQDLGRIQPLDKDLTGPAPSPAPGGGPSFAESLESAIRGVDGEMQAADKASLDYIGGKGNDLHSVLIQMERADLSFRTMVEVRNKLLEAYKEVMRMPV